MKKYIIILITILLPFCLFAQKFSIQKNGTVIDTENHLMWMQKDYDAYEGKHLPNYTWSEANEWCKSINKSNFGGYSDWRLPTVSEYKTLFRTAASRKMVNNAFILKNKEYAYWTCRKLNKYIATVVWTDEYYSDSQSVDPLLFEKNENVRVGHPSVLLVRAYKK